MENKFRGMNLLSGLRNKFNFLNSWKFEEVCIWRVIGSFFMNNKIDLNIFSYIIILFYKM